MIFGKNLFAIMNCYINRKRATNGASFHDFEFWFFAEWLQTPIHLINIFLQEYNLSLNHIRYIKTSRFLPFIFQLLHILLSLICIIIHIRNNNLICIFKTVTFLSLLSKLIPVFKSQVFQLYLLIFVRIWICSVYTVSV